MSRLTLDKAALEKNNPRRLLVKKIYSSSYIADCDQLRVTLSLAGIDSMMKNEFGNPIGLALIGGVAGFAAPELWVNENDYDQAMEIVGAFLKEHNNTPSDSATMETDFSEWQCPKCGETIEGTMNACWKCDTERTQ